MLKTLAGVSVGFFFSTGCFATPNQIACPTVQALRTTMVNYIQVNGQPPEFDVVSDEYNFGTNQRWWEHFDVYASSKEDAIEKVKKNLHWITFLWGPDIFLGTTCLYHIGVDGVNNASVSTWSVASTSHS